MAILPKQNCFCKRLVNYYKLISRAFKILNPDSCILNTCGFAAVYNYPQKVCLLSKLFTQNQVRIWGSGLFLNTEY